MTNTKHIGTATATLADLRRAAGLTRADLANRFRISVVAVGRWETGDAYPSVDLFEDLGETLGVDMNTLVPILRRTRRRSL